jgi:hypothetical protein
MSSLLQLNWKTFDLAAGIKISTGLTLMLLLTHLTGESWPAKVKPR